MDTVSFRLKRKWTRDCYQILWWFWGCVSGHGMGKLHICNINAEMYKQFLEQHATVPPKRHHCQGHPAGQWQCSALLRGKSVRVIDLKASSRLEICGSKYDDVQITLESGQILTVITLISYTAIYCCSWVNRWWHICETKFSGRLNGNTWNLLVFSSLLINRCQNKCSLQLFQWWAKNSSLKYVLTNEEETILPSLGWYESLKALRKQSYALWTKPTPKGSLGDFDVFTKPF